jgi:hypothetical protein
VYNILKGMGSHTEKPMVDPDMARGGIVSAPFKFLGTVQNLRISENKHPISCLDKTWVKQSQSIENSTTKREQAYCVPNRTTKNGLDF